MPKKKNKKLRNYGFIKPKITSDNHVLGGFSKAEHKLINPERDWIPFLPLGEVQRRKIDTNSCTEFGTLSAVDTLKIKYGFSFPDGSERALAIASGNTPDGNDPHKVAQTLHETGLITEVSLPFDDSILSWEQYMTPNPLPSSLTDEGKRWNKKFEFRHEWVFTGGTLAEKQEKLLQALTLGTVCVSVSAWKKRDGVYVKDKNDRDNHWTFMVAGEKGKPWTIFDSYVDDEVFFKKLDWNYDFGFAKLYFLKELPKKGCFLSKIFPCLS